MSILVESVSRHQSKFFNFTLWRKASSPIGPFDNTDAAKLVSDRYFAPKASGVALELLALPNVLSVEALDISTNSGIRLTNT